MKRSLLIFLSFLLPGCSQIQLGYRFADWAIESRFDQYLDLSSKQEEKLDSAIDSYIAWNRKTMVPRYIFLIEKIETRVIAQNWAIKHWRPLFKEADQLFEQTFWPFKEIIQTTLLSLTPAQVDHLEKQIQKDNKKKAKKFEVADAKYIERKKSENEELFQDWMGSITANQKLKIEAITRGVRFPVAEWLNLRKARQVQLLKILREKPRSQEKLNRFLIPIFKGGGSAQAKAYEMRLNTFRRQLADNVVELLTSLSEQQRDHFAAKLDKLRRDLGKL